MKPILKKWVRLAAVLAAFAAAAVLAACTADGDRKLRLALRDIAGHDRIEQLRPGLPELLGLGMVQNKVGDFLIETGHRAHLGIVERIGQEANVDHNVRLDGHTVLKAKREHVDIHKLLVGQLGKCHT